jgi:hypothetical protein
MGKNGVRDMISTCEHCGGEVDDYGFSKGGEVEDMSRHDAREGRIEHEAEQDSPEESRTSGQQDSTEELRHFAFADAVKRNAQKVMGKVEDDGTKPQDLNKTGGDDVTGDDEMKRRKFERYGSYGKKMVGK